MVKCTKCFHLRFSNSMNRTQNKKDIKMQRDWCAELEKNEKKNSKIQI